MTHRVVVTGIGMMTPLGLDRESSWQGLLEGRSGAAPITLFDPSRLDVKIACEVKGFDPLNYIDRKEVRRNDRFVQFALAVAQEALEHSGIQSDAHDPDRIGVCIASGVGGMTTLEEQMKVLLEKGPGRVSPFLIPMFIPDMAAGQVSMRFQLKGPNFGTVSACASGADSIGSAYEIIKRGDATAMVAGGAEAGVTEIGIAAFDAARALSHRNDEPERASRPFDADRDGFVLGEGAAVLVLEELEHALARGVPILAEIVGYGQSADAYHVTLPDEQGDGARRAMEMAMAKAGITPGAIDYINAHATSTPQGDKYETVAMKRVLGEYARSIPCSSTKSMTGHLLGAAGAVEAAICVLAIRDGIMPPTINLDTPDPECDLDYIPNVARRGKVRVAVSNAFGFGGHNSSLVFRAFERDRRE
jgi:3-oxoacyl-[acyl-carrier-protein] synthase II